MSSQLAAASTGVRERSREGWLNQLLGVAVTGVKKSSRDGKMSFSSVIAAGTTHACMVASRHSDVEGQVVCSVVRSFVRSFVGCGVGWLVGWLVGWFVAVLQCCSVVAL